MPSAATSRAPRKYAYRKVLWADNYTVIYERIVEGTAADGRPIPHHVYRQSHTAFFKGAGGIHNLQAGVVRGTRHLPGLIHAFYENLLWFVPIEAPFEALGALARPLLRRAAPLAERFAARVGLRWGERKVAEDAALRALEKEATIATEKTLPPSLASGIEQATTKAAEHSEITTLTNVEAEIAAADVLPQYKPGSGFSGVYDPSSGQWIALASGDASLLTGKEIQTVSQYGGHAAAERALVEKTGASAMNENVGFVVIWEGDNVVRIRWNSRSINARNFGDRAAPLRFRKAIRDVVQRDTGCRVVE